MDIKVGELETSLTFDLGDNERVIIEKPAQIDALEEAGVPLDYGALRSAYLHAVGNIEEVRKKQRIAKIEALWSDFWGNKMDLPTRPNLSWHLESKEDFVERATSRGSFVQEPMLFVKYEAAPKFCTKVRVRLVNTDRGGYYRSGSRPRFQIDHDITENKRRNYKSLDSLVDKVVELSDSYFEKQKRKKRAKEEAVQEKEETLELLNGVFGGAVAEQEYRFRFGTGGGYTVTAYYIVRGDRKFSIQKAPSKAPGTWVFAGLGYLETEQVQGVLDLLS